MLKTKDTWNALMRRIALKSAPSPCLLVGVATGLLGCTGVAPTRPTGVDVLKRIPGVGFDEAYASRVMLDLGNAVASVISVPHLIAAKRATGRSEDLLDVKYLEALSAAGPSKPQAP